jgi:HK97 family phage portal protein
MNFVKTINDKYNPLSKASLNRRAQTIAQQVISAVYTSQGDSGILPELSYHDLVNSYTSWVYTSVNKIAQTIAGAPKVFFTYKKKGTKDFLSATHIKQLFSALGEIKGNDNQTRYIKAQEVERVDITDNPLVKLFQQPNPVDTAFNFWYEMIMKLELAGAIGIYKKRGAMRLPTELWILPTSENGEFKVVPDAKLVIGGYQYSDGDIQTNFAIEDIIWPHYPNPTTKFEGYSPLRAQLYPYNIDKFLQQQQYYLFKNKSFVGGILSTDQALTKAQITDLKAQVSDSYRGVKKTGELMVTSHGLKYSGALNSGIGDTFIDDTSKMMKDRIFSAHGVNEGVVGLTENQNKANLDTSREIFIQECIRPRWKMLSEYLQKDLVAEFDDRIVIDLILPEFTQRILDVNERKINLDTGTTTINEERLKMKLEPVAWGDEPYIKQSPANPFGQAPAQPEPVKSIKGGEGSGNHGHSGRPGERGGSGEGVEGGGETSPKDSDILADKKLERFLQHKSLTPEAKQILWKKFDLAAKDCEKPFIEIMKKIFSAQRDEVLSNLESKGIIVKSHLAGWGPNKVRVWLSEHKDKVEANNIDKAKWEKKTAKLIEPAVKNALEKGAMHRAKEIENIKAKFEYSFDDESTAKWIGTKLRIFSEQVTGTTFDEIEKVLQSGFEEGKPLGTISSELRETFDTAEKYRANLIAQTEAANTFNQGDLDSVRQMGLEDTLLKGWLNEPDARPSHVQAGIDYSEDNAIGIDEDFSVGDDVMQVPGGGSNPSEVINCRCTLLWVKA